MTVLSTQTPEILSLPPAMPEVPELLARPATKPWNGRGGRASSGQRGLCGEALVQLRLTLPVAAGNLLQRGLLWITLAVVGHMGPEYLGPVTLATSVSNIMGTAVITGLTIAASTLASQAHGAGDATALGIVRQQAVVVNVLGTMPCVVLLLAMRPLTQLMQMDPDFVRRASFFALAVLPVAPSQGVVRANEAWLVAQKITLPRVIVVALTLVVHACLTLGLAFYAALGYVGVGVAMSLSNILQVAMLHGYVSCSSAFRHALQGSKQRSIMSMPLAVWMPYLNLALPGILVLSEYWVGESLVFCAGLLPGAAAQLSALAIYQLTQTTCFQVPNGLRMVVNTRVGNALGAGDASQAADSAQAGLRLVLLWVWLPTAFLLLGTEAWIRIFTMDGEVADLLRGMVWPLVLYAGMDAFLGYQNGVLNACGHQAVSGKWAIRGYVIIGLPLALLLAFPLRWGVLGLATGHCVGKSVHLWGCVLAVLRIDWCAEAARASSCADQRAPLLTEVGQGQGPGREEQDGVNAASS